MSVMGKYLHGLLHTKATKEGIAVQKLLCASTATLPLASGTYPPLKLLTVRQNIHCIIVLLYRVASSPNNTVEAIKEQIYETTSDGEGCVVREAPDQTARSIDTRPQDRPRLPNAQTE